MALVPTDADVDVDWTVIESQIKGKDPNLAPPKTCRDRTVEWMAYLKQHRPSQECFREHPCNPTSERRILTW